MTLFTEQAHSNSYVSAIFLWRLRTGFSSVKPDSYRVTNGLSGEPDLDMSSHTLISADYELGQTQSLEEYARCSTLRWAISSSRVRLALRPEQVVSGALIELSSDLQCRPHRHSLPRQQHRHRLRCACQLVYRHHRSGLCNRHVLAYQALTRKNLADRPLQSGTRHILTVTRRFHRPRRQVLFCRPSCSDHSLRRTIHMSSPRSAHLLRLASAVDIGEKTLREPRVKHSVAIQGG
jgi:hypothetical protein